MATSFLDPLAAALGLLVDRRCLGCGAGERPVCPDCAAELAGPPLRVRPPAPGSPPAWVAARYEGAARSLVLAAKEHGQGPPRAHLAAGLARALAAAPYAARGPLLLVPVPSTRAARRARGDDFVRSLAEAAAHHLRSAGLGAHVVPLVRPCGRRDDQVGLGAQARRSNVAGAFEVVPRRAARHAGRPVVVVDDIVTSGATLAEVARVLARAGTPVLGGAAVVATPSRSWPTCLAVAAPTDPGWG